MGDCKHCGKQPEPATQVPAEEPKITPFPNRFMMMCPGCNQINRMLPQGIQVGEEFQLVPCPKCHVAFRGRFHGDQVEEIV